MDSLREYKPSSRRKLACEIRYRLADIVFRRTWPSIRFEPMPVVGEPWFAGRNCGTLCAKLTVRTQNQIDCWHNYNLLDLERKDENEADER